MSHAIPIDSPARSWPTVLGRADDRRAAVLLFFAALVIRLAYALTDIAIPEINDMGVYTQLASGLLSGQGYVSELEPHFQSLRAPGYPFFLAAVYALFGESALAVLTLHAVMGATTCVIVFLIGRDLVGRATGSLAGVLCAINPEALHWTREFLTETLFTLLFALVVWGTIRVVRTGSLKWLLTTGLLLGYATLVRPNLLLFVPVVALIILQSSDRSLRWRVMACSAMAVTVVAVLAPWTVRNYLVHGEFVPVASIGGFALNVALPADEGLLQIFPVEMQLEIGRHETPSGYDMSPELFGQKSFQPLPEGFNELEESRLGREVYVRYMLEDPLRFAKLMGIKLSMVFNPLPREFPATSGVDYGFGEWDVAIRYGASIFFFYSFVFGALGAVETFALRSPILLLHGVLLYQIGFLLIFRPALRYLLPGLLICSVFTARGTLLASRLRSWLVAGSPADRVRLAIWASLTVMLSLNAYHYVFLLRPERRAQELDAIRGLLGLG